MWDEIRLARMQSRIAFPEASATELRVTDANYIQGISTNEAVKFQGIHGRNILIIADEAPGIRADIWDAIEGVRAGGDVHVLMLGNPVIPSGYFFNAFGTGRAIWDTCTISAFDTPNLAGVTMEQLLAMSEEELAYSPSPYLVTRRWVKERALAWGQMHPMFRARVLGEFPSQSAYSVYSLELIERAKRDPTPQENELLKTARIQIGIDVAGPGEDETVVVVRSGGCVLETHAFADADPRGRVVQVLGKWQRTGRLQAVLVDVIGIGYNFAFHLADLGFPVVQFNAGFRPIDTERFTNLKAEAYWQLREHMESGAICGLNDLETEAQLAGILYRPTSSGRTEIESKDDARRRGQRSPDRAEALVLAFYKIVLREQTVVYGERKVISQF
jgi:phage terminase large subunit